MPVKSETKFKNVVRDNLEMIHLVNHVKLRTTKGFVVAECCNDKVETNDFSNKSLREFIFNVEIMVNSKMPIRHRVILDGKVVATYGRALIESAEYTFQQIKDKCIGTNSTVKMVTSRQP